MKIRIEKIISKALIIILIILCIVTGCGKTEQYTTLPERPDSSETTSVVDIEDISHTENTDVMESDSEDNPRKPMWYEAVNWDNYPKRTDINLFFTGNKIEAPVTMEVLEACIEYCTIAPADPDSFDRESVPISELRTSDVTVNKCKFGIPNNGEYYLEYIGDNISGSFREMAETDSYYIWDTSSSHIAEDYFGVDDTYPDDPAPDGYTTFAFYKWQLESILGKYGRPSYAVTMKGFESMFAKIYWERDGYLFGCLVTNESIYDSEPKYEVADIYYYTANAWNYYTNSEEFSEKYKLLPFDEYIGVAE